MGQPRSLVCGAGGFIGGYLVHRLVRLGHRVRGVDLEPHAYGRCPADEFVRGDLRDPDVCRRVLDGGFDRVFQLAARMGGAGYLFRGENDADVMHDSALVNLNVAAAAADASRERPLRVFFSSSACVYPEHDQSDPNDPRCPEDSVYPARPDSEYGWEKLFGERLYDAFRRNRGLEVRIARYHNVFGPYGAWGNGREKAPAALCRKVARAEDGDAIEVWGDGRQTRTFLYVDDCIDATLALVDSEVETPLNVGSEELVTLDELARLVIDVSGKRLGIRHVEGPQGVRGRRSDNRAIERALGWKPAVSLRRGLERTYAWIEGEVRAGRGDAARGQS